jgi:hypothetical protein
MKTRLRISMLLVTLLMLTAAHAEEATVVKVYKTPTCGCCVKWIDHLEQAGFSVESETLDNVTPIKAANGVPPRLESCHTAIVDGYVVEGHVPADIISRLLAEKPDIAGVAVPGMPVGSPGMEMGGRKDPYQVVSFDDEGNLAVYAER